MDSSKDNSSVKKIIRDSHASKPFQENRRFIPSKEESFQSITENLVLIYKKLQKLEKPGKQSNDSVPNLTSLEEKISSLEEKIILMDSGFKLNEIEKRLAKIENEPIVKEITRDFYLEKRLEEVENILDKIDVENKRQAIIHEKILNDIVVSNSILESGMKKMMNENSYLKEFISRELSSQLEEMGSQLLQEINNYFIKIKCELLENDSEQLESVNECLDQLSKETTAHLEKMQFDIISKIFSQGQSSKNDLMKHFTSSFQLIDGKLEKVSLNTITGIGNISEILDEVHQSIMFQDKKIDSFTDDIDVMYRQILEKTDSLRDEMVERFNSQFDSIKDEIIISIIKSVTSQNKLLLNSLEENIQTTLSEYEQNDFEDCIEGQLKPIKIDIVRQNIVLSSLKDEIKSELSVIPSELRSIDVKMNELIFNQSTKATHIEFLRNKIEQLAREQSLASSKLQQNFHNIQGGIKSSIEPINSAKESIKEMTQTIKGLSGSMTSCLESNVELVKQSSLDIEKIQQNLKELQYEMEDGNIVKEIKGLRNDLEEEEEIVFEEDEDKVDEDEIREQFFQKMKEVIEGHKNIQDNQNNLGETVEKKVQDILKSQQIITEQQEEFSEDMNKNFFVIFESQKEIQKQQNDFKEEVNSLEKVVENEGQKTEENHSHISKELSCICEETSGLNEGVQDVNKMLSKTKDQYIAALQCEMEICRSNIIQGIRDSISSRNSGPPYRRDGNKYSSSTYRN